ncbi:hypothetical protein [Sphingomonas hankookensis]|uniref:hypothetical protein n=1 Tax=Sphingomonas hankookensis TaxID=563996 RepID=UPI00234E5876|nr:hypothetical protein [Sphingomonas hankookensis]WCP71552.1 hypothetical protein PPZ50_14505 [Sphingomonas hankookensis]
MTARNPLRGQLAFTVGETAFTFAFTTNALCEVEEAFQLDDITGLEAVLNGKPSLRTIRTLFRIGLTDCHPDMTDREAGTIMEAVGGLEPSLELIMLAVQQAFPEAAPAGAGNPRRPPRGGRGTGRNSMSTGVQPGAA